MQKYIRINDSTELIPVSEVYAFIYDGGIGKNVLRMYIDSTTKNYDELFSLFNDGVDKIIYEYWDIENEEDPTQVDRVLMNQYQYYSKDYQCVYNGGDNYLDYPNHYYIELLRKPPEQIEAETLAETISDSNLALASIYESKLV